MSLSRIDYNLENEEYSKAMGMIGGYYNDDYNLIERNDKKLIIFESATFSDNDTKLNKTYSFFVYPILDYIKGEELKLIVNGNLEISLYDFDSNGDEEKDDISSLINNKYLYFSISEIDVTGTNDIINDIINDIKIVGSNEIINVTGLNLDFNKDFFEDVNDFILAYNENSNNLDELDKAFRAKSEHYMRSDDQNIKEKAFWTDVLLVVLIGFIMILFYDVVLGKRILFKLISKLFKKSSKEGVDVSTTES